MNKPPYGITMQVTPVSNYDGDTAKLEFKQILTVRITDEDGTFDTPEISRPKSEEEKYVGLLAKDAVQDFLESGEPLTLHVGDHKVGYLGDSFAVGNRIAGRVWNKDGIELADYIKDLELTKEHSRFLEQMSNYQGNIEYTYYDDIEKSNHTWLIPEYLNSCGLIESEYVIPLKSLNFGGYIQSYLFSKFTFDINHDLVYCIDTKTLYLIK